MFVSQKENVSLSILDAQDSFNLKDLCIPELGPEHAMRLKCYQHIILLRLIIGALELFFMKC